MYILICLPKLPDTPTCVYSWTSMSIQTSRLFLCRILIRDCIVLHMYGMFTQTSVRFLFCGYNYCNCQVLKVHNKLFLIFGHIVLSVR